MAGCSFFIVAPALAQKELGSRPRRGLGLLSTGLLTVEKLKGGVPLETEYFEKNAYYRKPDRPELRGYGTQTNKDNGLTGRTFQRVRRPIGKSFRPSWRKISRSRLRRRRPAQ